MNLKKLTFLLLATSVFLSAGVLAVQPFGVTNITRGNSTRATPDLAANTSAIAGNVTELTIFGYSVTQTWQGYYGNVTGTIVLSDAQDHQMYNWTLASPEGEIYATTAGDSLDWTDIQCFNFTADGTFADDSANRGATSQHGMNLAQLEAAYNITWDDVDGVNETFSLDGSQEHGGGLQHELFYTNNLQFDPNECVSAHLFKPNGAIGAGDFQEVMLYEPTSQAVVWTSILDEEDIAGYDGKYHDFEMLVLDDGHGTDLATTTYYFYAELE